MLKKIKIISYLKRIAKHGGLYWLKVLIFNFNTILYKVGILKKDYSLEEYHNKYFGEECFIVGNGPSLTIKDLELIREKKIKSFATNKIHLMFDKTPWRPDFFLLHDFTFKKQQIHVLKDIMDAHMKLYFFSHDFKKILKDEESNHAISYFRKTVFSPLFRVKKFSKDADKYIIDGATITYSAIQLAVYMGFKKIYLLGIDCNYSQVIKKDGTMIKNNGIKDYFTNKYDKNFVSTSNIDAMFESFNVSKKYCDEIGVEIHNATRGGKLEVFPRVKIEEIFK